MNQGVPARRTPYWSEALDSLVYPSSYARVALQPLGRTLRYLAWLIAWAALGAAVLAQIQLVQWARTDAPGWLRRLPAFTITDGHVHSPAPQPWVYAAQGGELAFVLDTTGQTTTLDARYPQGVLLTEHQLILKRGPRRIQTMDLSQVGSFVFNAEVGHRWLHRFLWWSLPLVWAMTGLYLAVTKPLQIVFFSIWAMLLNSWLGRGWNYRALWTMGAYALTGPAVLNLLIAWVAPTLPLQVGGFLVSGVYLLYLILAVWNYAPGTRPPQEDAAA